MLLTERENKFNKIEKKSESSEGEPYIKNGGKSMDYTSEKNNKVYLSGEIVSPAVYSHEVFGEGFYEFSISVNRLSGQADVLPVTISERLVQEGGLDVGSHITAEGQFRSYNKVIDGKSKLMLTVFIRELLPENSFANPNSIILSGYVCKPPVYRTTPFNREIADILIAVNRAYGKSDYIPAIAWGRNARFVKNLSVGEKITVSGRIQSREYQKRISDTEIKVLTAYEVSVSKLAVNDNSLFLEQDADFYARRSAGEFETVR